MDPKREQELLPVGYYHVVFTLPSELNALAMHQPRLVYNTLIKVAWSVIKVLGRIHLSWAHKQA
jgi:hypothetical protein